MSVQGDARRHYNWDSILLRHWRGLAKRCGISAQFDSIVAGRIEVAPKAIDRVESLLPKGFPDAVHEPILKGLANSARRLASEFGAPGRS